MPADVAIPAVVGPVRHGPLRSFFADFLKSFGQGAVSAVFDKSERATTFADAAKSARPVLDQAVSGLQSQLKDVESSADGALQSTASSFIDGIKTKVDAAIKKLPVAKNDAQTVSS